MTAREYIVCAVCKTRKEGPVYQNSPGHYRGFDAQRDLVREARAQGWRVFVGRSTRWYCPNHEPKPGHRMHEVTS